MFYKSIGIGVMMSVSVVNVGAQKDLLTHSGSNIDSINLTPYKERLVEKTERTFPLDQELALLEELSQFELGRFLLHNKGLNGYWTSYIIKDFQNAKDLHPLEEWIVTKAPTVKATQERFKIFQSVLHNYVKKNTNCASIPCGIMDDFLTLPFENSIDVHFTGIDLDPASLELAKENAQKKKISQVAFLKKDAWNLGIASHFDVITSNGLNIYEADDARVVALYSQFNQALKKGGVLVTSFLTPPPTLSKESTWKNVNVQDALKQKALFSDVIGVGWQAFRTEEQTRQQLQKAGFEVLEVVYDSQGIFPTIVAKKF